MSATGPLVVVFCRGGADGLSLLAPTGEDYAALRGVLAIPAESLQVVGEGFGLHPGLTALHRLYSEGSLALVPAAGIPEMSRSHFDAQFRVEAAAAASGSPAGGGWLGRHLAATAGDQPNPWRGISFGQAGRPHLLSGSADTISATALSALSLGARQGLGAGVGATLEEMLLQMWSHAPQSDLGSAALGGLEALGTASRITGGESTGQKLPGLADTVAVLGAGVGTEVAVLNVGGWDTHTDQGTLEGTFADLAGQLDSAIEALVAVADTTVVVLTEFGRRVAPNSSAGCDHGRGGLAMVTGPGVAGGIRGDWPGLSDLDEGDVRTANDLRVLMAEVTTAVLGGDPAEILGEVPSGRLGLFA